MIGQAYFYRRFVDISHLSPIPYLCGDAELRFESHTFSVLWELAVSVTGESLLVLSSDSTAVEPRLNGARPHFSEWQLVGTCHQDQSTILASGVTLPSCAFHQRESCWTYFSHFRTIYLDQADAPNPRAVLHAMEWNLTFLGLEATETDSDWKADHFRASVAHRTCSFVLAPCGPIYSN